MTDATQKPEEASAEENSPSGTPGVSPLVMSRSASFVLDLPCAAHGAYSTPLA
jgi:hypothetical protein